MSAVDLDADTGLRNGSFSHVSLPRYASLLVVVIALALSALLVLLLGWNWVACPVVAAVLTVIALPLWSAAVENRRKAVDRLVTSLVWCALLVALVPLVWVLAQTVVKGAPELTGSFLTHDMTQKLDPTTFKMLPGAGVAHALVGTLLVTLGATIISVPIGLMTAVYLVEYGRGKLIARWTTLLVDVMTGIPSIVAGLFALALFTVISGVGTRFGLMGSIALSLLMIPTVVRSAEEMMRLVPNDLREASYALGVPKWRTIVKMVIPTAFGGIITGVMLAVSRVIGETAPLLVAIGSLDVMNTNLFSGRMQTLPVYILNEYKKSTPHDYDLAWAGALLLILIVMILNLIARIVGKIFAPKTGR
ncbi:phosphate ABC transporter permease PstA [Nocardioides sp. KR10-350]|uniref:phosphate ABC transporter permease PstA n=1 Tax=Nocardioides cheoyonin TaxID=3156615 RepID=UPI0032B3B9E5